MNPSISGRTTAMHRTIRGPVLAIVMAVGLIAGACAGSSSPAPSAAGTAAAPSYAVATAPAAAVPVATPISTADANPGENAKPAGSPVAAATPKHTSLAAGWTTPVHVGPTVGANGPYCEGLVTGIDTSSRQHMAVACGGRITYSLASQGGSWASVTFTPPAHRIEMRPQLAFRGNLIYLAYTRIAVTEGACGDNGLRDVGVYYRTRLLPDGGWSSPIRLGAANDGVESFRVAGSTIFATVQNRTSGIHYFEVLKGGVTTRYRLAGAVGGASLRVGLDGRARIVYPTAKSLRYAVFSGSGFTTTSIPKTSSRAGQAQLVLGPGDVPQVAWLSTDQGAGCATGEDPADGLYVGTEHGTTWASLRLATGVGPFSLQVDPATGRIVVLQWAGGRMVFHSKDPGRPWVTTVVRGNYQFSGPPQLRIDPATESLMVAWIGDDGANVMNHP